MDMKKTYETPKAEVERYQLDASIASNCETVVHNGPQMNGYSQCSDYIDPFETYSAARSVHNVQFIRKIRATVTRQQAAVTGHPEHKEKQKKRGTGDAHHVMPWRRENLSGL